MRTVKLNIHESVYEHIMFLLKNLKTDKLEIIEDKKSYQKKNTKEKVKELFNDKNITLFDSIKDPLEWQKKLRDEWQ